nr:immunoglobulin light chain junction region [Macaca mulatta]
DYYCYSMDTSGTLSIF